MLESTWILDPGRGIRVSRPAGIMGILNATPDSFSDGGQFADADAAVLAGQALVAAGATWLDVGGESTRPGAAAVPAGIQIARIVPVIRRLREQGVAAWISVDTRLAEVAESAFAAGADAVNDVSAGTDPGMFPLLARTGRVGILMHMQGEPATMQRNPDYGDVVLDVIGHLCRRIDAAERVGVARASLAVDPGIGFGKTVAHNRALLGALERIERETGRPVVVGVSRKSLLPTLAGVDPAALPAAARDPLSHVLHAALAPRCALLRVHDVAGCAAALRLARSLPAVAHGAGAAHV